MNKRSWIFTIILCLLLAGGAALVLLPRIPMPWQCSKIYWQYRGQEGIKASYVRDYPVDDTTLVDVTLLQATTDSAWKSLCIAFTPYEFVDSSEYINKLIHDTTSVTFRAVSKDDYKKRIIPKETHYCNFNFIIQSAKVKSIGIFQIKSEPQYNVILETISENLLFNNKLL